jgi:hypothetical protein
MLTIVDLHQEEELSASRMGKVAGGEDNQGLNNVRFGSITQASGSGAGSGSGSGSGSGPGAAPIIVFGVGEFLLGVAVGLLS